MLENPELQEMDEDHVEDDNSDAPEDTAPQEEQDATQTQDQEENADDNDNDDELIEEAKEGDAAAISAKESKSKRRKLNQEKSEETYRQLEKGFEELEHLVAAEKERARAMNAFIKSQHFSDEQLDRIAAARRSTLPKSGVHKIISSVIPKVPKQMIIAMAGIAKLYVGDLIEAAVLLKQEKGHKLDEPIEPSELLEAYRRVEENTKVKNKLKYSI